MKSPKPLTLQFFIGSLTDRQKARFAKLAKTTVAHLAQLSGGHRRASPEMARRLVRASERIFSDSPERHLSLAVVRPDIWGDTATGRSPADSARV